MNGPAIRPGAIWLALILASNATAQEKAPAPLARYVPADGLTVLVEHNGLDSRPDAWKATAAYKLLNATPLGPMLDDIAVQVADAALRSVPGAPVTGRELVGLLRHLGQKGFAIGYCGTFNPPQPRAGVLVIREAKSSEVFKRLIAMVPPLNEPAAKPVATAGGRKVLQSADSPIRWWYEGDDAVFSYATPDGPDPVVDTLEGKTPSALKHPARVALATAGPDAVPVGLLFVDLTSLPPLPPQAVAFGIDGVKRVEASWGFQDRGIVTMLGVLAPRPRRGVVALFDQPPIGAGTKLVGVKGDATLLSLDPIKFGDAVMALMQQNDPQSVAAAAQFGERFRARTGLGLRDDLLSKLGPRMAIIPPPGGGGLGSIFGMWFHPPDLGVVIELKDAKGFLASLDRLIAVANIELKSAGAMVPPREGEEVRPGTNFAEFRPLKAPERGYVLSVPTSVLPTPAGFRPTIVVDLDRGLVALGGTVATARRTLAALVLDGPAPADGSFFGGDAVLFSHSDPSGTLPELLVNIPSLVQFVGLAASQPNGPQAQPAMPPFRLQLDPDAIPDVEAIRRHLFPSRVTLAVDDGSIRLSSYQAFPIPAPQLNVGMEAPVLVALLLPAVQAAREAARRSQCMNNLKQIGLAMANYESAKGNFPTTTIADKAGKPLLSWRVAILPFIDQQSLYEKFHLDEPWDSPHNKELIKLMPPTYSCPSRRVPVEPGTTTYRIIAGPGSLLDPTKPTRVADVTDGTSNTLMVVESNDASPWTKPDDLPFDPEARPPADPFFGAASMHPGGFNALMCDGSVRFIKRSVAVQTFRALITRAGGEIISADAY